MTSNTVTITDFSQLSDNVSIRVEAVTIEQGKGQKDIEFFVREMRAEDVTAFQQSVPDVKIEEVGQGDEKKQVRTVLNSTNRMDAAKIVASVVVKGADDLSLLKGGSNGVKEWAKLPNRILQPLLEKALELSDLNQDDEGKG